MPYMDVWYVRDYELYPSPEESYTDFVARVTAGLKTLYPDLEDTEIQYRIDCAWKGYILSQATEAVVTLRRNIDPNSIYNDSWADWDVTDIHSAVLPKITYSSVEKARAASGDSFRIAKSNEEKQFVFGWANIAKQADGSYPLDWDGDVTTPEELEKAAYTHVLKYRAAGEQHQGEAIGNLIESVVFTKEKQEALGIPPGIMPEGWWVGFHIPDKQVFAKVKSGEYEMLSVQGSAQRVPTGQ